MFIKKSTNISVVKSGPANWGSYFAIHFTVDADITVLFPYIKAEIRGAVCYEKPHHLKFIYEDHQVVLHTDKIVIGLFTSPEEAKKFIPELITFLNNIFDRRTSIKPDYKMKGYVPVLDIYRLLPRTNCRECRYPTCMAFAAAVSNGEALPDKCPNLGSPISEKLIYPLYNNEGYMTSTVAIDIDSKKRRHEFEKQRKLSESLKKKTDGLKIDHGRMDSSDTRTAGLTKREKEVLCLMAEGLTNNEISGLLAVSPHTVKSHVLNIFNKIGVNDRTQASVWAARNNLI